MVDNIHNFTPAPQDDIQTDDLLICGRCELGGLTPDRARIAFWRDDGLVVVRNIPAMKCPTCGEEYVGDEEVLGLDRMRGQGFAGHPRAGRLIVPVIDYADVVQDMDET